MGDLLLTVDQLSMTEKYALNASDQPIRFAAGKNVHLTLEADHHSRERDSSRVQSRMLSDYKWDISNVRSYADRLLAVQGNLIAYRICHEATGEAVRVMERETRNRQLIKGFRRPIVDVQWSRLTSLLAVLDSDCNLYVYHVHETCTIEKFLNIIWTDGKGDDKSEDEKEKQAPPSRPRFTWCPYIPEDSDPSDQLNLLAVTFGRDVHVINLSTLKAAKESQVELNLSEARKVEGAVLSVSIEHEVTALCLSPDATAVAIADSSGLVSFYIIDSNELRFAHNWNPQMGFPLRDLFFLDNINALEQFWRFCVAADSEGRSLCLFECENWTCIGRLKLDSPLNLSKFTVHTDPHSRYIYLIDIDGANMFCVELDYSTGAPLFSSITQICFYHPLVAVAPFDVKDAEPADLSFDDEEEITSPTATGSSGTKPAEVHVSLVAISPKSVLLLDVSLDKSEPRESHPSDSLLRAARESQMELLSALGVMPSPSSANPQMAPSSSGEHFQPPPADTSAFLDKQNEHFEALVDKIEQLNEKIEQLTHKMERAEEERRASVTNQSILSLLQQFKDEFSLREDRLLANISDLIETSRGETIRVVRNALNENSLAVENSIQANHKLGSEALTARVAERCKEAVTSTIIPTVERTCGLLFKQINEQFKEGLNQYLAQVRMLQAATLATTVASTPAPLCQDRQSLLILIKNRQIQLAFENVLNQADESVLEFVCKNVDPDELFGSGGSGLSQPVLLSLLQQLSYHLEVETDLKFRYMEHILEEVRPSDETIAVHVPRVRSVISDALEELQLRSPNSQMKRQARVIKQLAAKALK